MDSKVEEWAIQDEATGEWWTGARWRAAGPDGNVWGNYRHVCETLAEPGCITFEEGRAPRIVPAPPREMTDTECWEWLHSRKTSHALPFIRPTDGDAESKAIWACSALGSWGYGATPCDAIRAARRKLEGK